MNYTTKIGKIPTNSESDTRKRNLKNKNNLQKEINIKINKNIEKNKDEKDSLRNFYENINNYVENKQSLETEKLIIIYRNIGFICLSSIFYSVMKTIFTSDKMLPYFSVVVTGLFNIIKKYRAQIPKNAEKNTQNINVENEIYVDLSTKFLHNLMKQAPSITLIHLKIK